MDISDWPIWNAIIQTITEVREGNWIVRLAAAVIATVLVYFAGKLVRHASPKFWRMWTSHRRLERARHAVAREGKGLWLARSFDPQHPRDYAKSMRTSVPIITIAHLKGGVGKTTTAANLIAHYAIKKGQSVLGLDVDFQGSLTSMCLSQADRKRLSEEQADGSESKAGLLIDDKDAFWLRQTHERVVSVDNARLIPSYYSLSATENRVMVEWLIGERRHDIRYRLAEILHADEVQRRFNLIIIDAPPRLTTACVQALCASTHVLVPTVLDMLSAEAVGTFADQLRVHQHIWPHLRVAGVLGTMVEASPVDDDGKLKDPPLRDFEADAYVTARDSLSEALKTASKPLREATMLPMECCIPDVVELGRAAGQRIAYAAEGNTPGLRKIRGVFDRIGDELDRRLAAPRTT